LGSASKTILDASDNKKMGANSAKLPADQRKTTNSFTNKKESLVSR